MLYTEIIIKIFNFYDFCHSFTNKYTNCFTQNTLCAIGSIRLAASPAAQLQFSPGAVLFRVQCGTAQVGNGEYYTDPGFPGKTSKRCHLQHYLSCNDLLHQRLSLPPVFRLLPIFIQYCFLSL